MVVRSVENGKNKQKYVVKMGWEEKGKKNKNNHVQIHKSIPLGQKYI